MENNTQLLNSSFIPPQRQLLLTPLADYFDIVFSLTSVNNIFQLIVLAFSFNHFIFTFHFRKLIFKILSYVSHPRMCFSVYHVSNRVVHFISVLPSKIKKRNLLSLWSWRSGSPKVVLALLRVFFHALLKLICRVYIFMIKQVAFVAVQIVILL